MFRKLSFLVFVALAGNQAIASPESFVKGRKLVIDFKVSAHVTPGSDPCIGFNHETGTAQAKKLVDGDLVWDSNEVVNFCTHGTGGPADAVGIFSLRAANNDVI